MARVEAEQQFVDVSTNFNQVVNASQLLTGQANDVYSLSTQGVVASSAADVLDYAILGISFGSDDFGSDDFGIDDFGIDEPAGVETVRLSDAAGPGSGSGSGSGDAGSALTPVLVQRTASQSLPPEHTDGLGQSTVVDKLPDAGTAITNLGDSAPSVGGDGDVSSLMLNDAAQFGERESDIVFRSFSSVSAPILRNYGVMPFSLEAERDGTAYSVVTDTRIFMGQ